jgi:hypothetical protein
VDNGKTRNRQKTMKRCLLLAACAFAIGPARGAEPLGRLFFTPPQRAQLDVARSQKSRVTLASENQQEAAPAPEIITYSGVVRRSDGQSTIWINNKPVTDGQAISGVPLSGRVGANGVVTLRLPQSDRPIELKVGQSLEIGSGTVEEPYSRRPAPTPKPDAQPAPKPAATAAAPESASAEPKKGERDRDDQQTVESAVRVLQEAASARSAAAAKQAAPAPPRGGP